MKKVLFTLLAALTVTIAAQAQPRSVGATLGYNMNISYQHTVHNADFIETSLGTAGFESLDLYAGYNFMIAQPNWTSRGEWGFYAGPGLAIGTGFDDGYAFSLGFTAQVGLEYTFWFPLQLSLDLRPRFGFKTSHNHVSFHESALYGFTPTLSIRYRF